MSLDIHKIASKIETSVSHLASRQEKASNHINKAAQFLLTADPSNLEQKRVLSNPSFLMAGIQASLSKVYEPPELPENHSVFAVDGSHIDVDRHMAMNCYLINIGKVYLQYGIDPKALVSNEPFLYSEDRTLQIYDPEGNRSQNIEGPLLGAVRAVEEMRSLVKLLNETDSELPSLVLIDGSLILWGIVGQTYPDFVRRQLLDEMFLPAMQELADISNKRPLALASYISLPRSKDVVNTLRLDPLNCPYDLANCDTHCGSLGHRNRPCDGLSEILDRDIFDLTLQDNQRSDHFITTSSIVERYYGENIINFYYLKVGNEIARIEIPKWVCNKPELLDLTHSILINQCQKGHGYPVSIMEAHEQAVVTTSDREEFRIIVEEALQRHNLPNYTSEKNRSKRIRWI